MEKQIEDLRTGRSILNTMATRSAALQKQLGVRTWLASTNTSLP
jgi:hypothetical protein